MPATLIATVGSDQANSYVSVSDADAYFANRTGTDKWDAASDDQKAQALIMATWRIDQEQFVGIPVHPLNGTISDQNQALRWPRYAALDDEGWEYHFDVVPQRVQNATCELALEILGGGTSLTDTGMEGFADVKLGTLSVTPRSDFSAGQLPRNVRRFLGPLLASAAGAAFHMERA